MDLGESPYRYTYLIPIGEVLFKVVDGRAEVNLAVDPLGKQLRHDSGNEYKNMKPWS